MITLNDIAQKAKVSKTTVSLVLNDRDVKNRISEETRKKVLLVAEELDYSRNDLAIAVKTGKTRMIAFVSYNLGTWEYVGKIMSGILKETTRQDYSLKVYDSSSEKPEILTKKLLQQRIAGVVFHGLRADDFNDVQQRLNQAGIICAVSNLTNMSSGIGVTTDDYAGMKLLVKHLVDQGHRRIAYISRDGRSEYVKNREEGFIAGLKECLPKQQPEIVYVKDASGEENDKPLKQLLSQTADTRPTALACFTDGVAVGAMRAAYELNIKIPDQLAVTGFGGLEFANTSVVPLTTVEQPFAKMGSETAALLIKAIDQKNSELLETNINVKVPTNLVIRKSTMWRVNNGS